MSNVPSEKYHKLIDTLDDVVGSCINTSHKFGGVPSPTRAHFYASVLFTSLCSRGVSLAILCPYSLWAQKKVEHWDYASIAGMVRSILEIRLAFFYLGIEECSEKEWECRWNIFNIHDCKSRIRLFEEMSPENQEIEKFETQMDELRSRLMENSFFMSFPEKQRNKFLKGRDAYLCPLEEIGLRAGVERRTFRWIYKLLSSHVHGLPMSFYRISSQERGRGVHSEIEEFYTSLCLTFAISLLTSANHEMKQIFDTEIFQ